MRLHARFRWLPTPFRSLFLFFIWLLLNNSISLGHIVLGVLLALLIPLLSMSFRDPQPLIVKPWVALRQFFIVLFDIIVANLEVAILIMGPSKNLRPGFVKVPIDLMHEMPITILASCVSLTPGTVSADVYPLINSLNEDGTSEQRYLLLHVLDLDDEQALIQRIKSRYEAPLKEIFQC